MTIDKASIFSLADIKVVQLIKGEKLEEIEEISDLVDRYVKLLTNYLILAMSA